MRDLNLDDLVGATRAVDRPGPEHADALFDKIVSGAGLPLDGGAGDSLPPETAVPVDPSAIATGTQGAGAVATTAAAVGGGSNWIVVAVLTAAGMGGLGTWLAVDSTPDEVGAPKSSLPAAVQAPLEGPLDEPESAELPAAEDDTAAEEDTASLEPNGEREAPQPTVTARAPTSKQPLDQDTPTTKTDTLALEVALIRSAKQALDQKSLSRSLSLLDSYDAQFPQGTLRGEAWATRVLVLCAMNRPARARAVAGQIDADSPLAKKLESGCPVK